MEMESNILPASVDISTQEISGSRIKFIWATSKALLYVYLLDVQKTLHYAWAWGKV